MFLFAKEDAKSPCCEFRFHIFESYHLLRGGGGGGGLCVPVPRRTTGFKDTPQEDPGGPCSPPAISGVHPWRVSQSSKPGASRSHAPADSMFLRLFAGSKKQGSHLHVKRQWSGWRSL